MLQKATDSDEKQRLSKMLESGKQHVQDLSTTLQEAKERLNQEIDSVEIEDKRKEEEKQKAEQDKLLKKQ